ncbi:transcription initiation factor IIA subunit 1-like protein [Carex littledalei]|uniref:Transcription initiation factor IIA subunit 1-like protein n=1 Tax=Carex littledalei TaxID=544730 RepID=A0A833VZK9_9POAL|nr:transcription initiation factor IIA subunit 1-like protein [Carex littledalei]
MASNVSRVYIEVIDDVVGKVRDEFINYGAGEAVLNELQSLWEMKMVQMGAISGNIERPAAASRQPGQVNPVHDLNVPYEGPTEEYETPTAEMLFPPTPLQTPIQTPLPGMEQGMYNIPTGPSDYAPSPLSDMRNGVDMKAPRNNHYMQPPSPWMAARPLGVDVNVAYVEGREDANREAPHQPATQMVQMQDFFTAPTGKRKRDEFPSQMPPGSYNMPQQDGSSDAIIEFEVSNSSLQVDRRHEKATGKGAKECSSIPQRDGIDDEYESLFPLTPAPAEDYNNVVQTPAEHVELRAPTPVVAVGTPKPTPIAAGDDEEPPLNEDDDDDDDLDDLEQGEEEPTTQHLVLAQFDKVTRTKNRWKCTLKDGIMHLHSRDILFNKAMGEFDF